MPEAWLPLAAEVDWRSGHRGFETPTAVRAGGERLGLEIETSWTEGPARAGGPLLRTFIVRDASGRRLRVRVDARGRTSVEVQTAP